MKVVFCTYDGENVINGINVWLLNLLPALQNNGFEIAVLISAWSPEEKCVTLPLLRKANIACTVINSKGYTEAEVKWILEYVKDKQPDAFVCNNMLQACYAAKWIVQAGIPAIAVLHNDDREYEAILDEFASGKNGFKLSGIVAVSDVLQHKLSPYPSAIVKRKIACGVPIPLTKNKYKPGQVFKIAYIGRLAQEQKNIARVVKAFCQTLIKTPDVEAYIYGSGPDQEIVNQVIKEFNYPEKLILKGNLTPGEIQQELSQLHAIVLMSDYEGLPVSLMEAMAFGVVPVCTYIKSGVPELVIADLTGLYLNQPDDLGKKISDLKDDAGQWEFLSANANKHIKEGFSIQACTAAWIQLLNEIAPAKTKSLRIPRKVKLPAPQINLSLFDRRDPGFLKKAWRKIKREIKKQ